MNRSQRTQSPAKKSGRRKAALLTTGFVVLLSGILCINSVMAKADGSVSADIISGSVSLGSQQTKSHIVGRSVSTAATVSDTSVQATVQPVAASTTASTAAVTPVPVATDNDEKPAAPAVTAKSFGSKISEWNAVNSDVKGWIQVGGTNIDYPVIFYPEDTNYYTHLNYKKQYDTNGVIWADANAIAGSKDSLATNTVIYGHNWTNYSTPKIGDANDIMFGQLPAFHYLDFAKNNQFIHFSTSEGDMVFQIFAVFYTEVDFIYNNCNPTTEEMKNIVIGARNRSLHNYDVKVTTNDKLITLSTCTRVFGKSSRQRFVVMGKLVDPATVTPATLTANPNYQRPVL